MKKIFLSAIFVFIVLWFETPNLQASIFRGEVTQINRADGTVTILYRDQNRQPVEKRTFRLPTANDPGTLQTLSALEIGDELQVEASKINGNWEIHTFVSNPNRPGGVIGAVGPTALEASQGAAPAPSQATLTTNRQPLAAAPGNRVPAQNTAVPATATAVGGNPQTVLTTTTVPAQSATQPSSRGPFGNPVVQTAGGFAQPLEGTNDPPPTLSSSNQGAGTSNNQS